MVEHVITESYQFILRSSETVSQKMPADNERWILYWMSNRKMHVVGRK